MKVREHGTRAKYVTEKCRCDACRNANRVYQVARDRASRRPDEVARSAFVPVGPVRRHMLELRAAGVGYVAVAAAAGVGSTSLMKILNGESRKCLRRTAELVLAVTPSAVADGALVDAGPTWELIERLLAAGWTKCAISAAIGQDGRALQLRRDRILARNARAIAELAATLPPNETRAEYVTRAVAATDEFEELYGTLASIIEERQEPWRRRAACSARQISVSVFYVGQGETVEHAHELCARCPVTEECAAAGRREREGTWGGISAKERRTGLEDVA